MNSLKRATTWVMLGIALLANTTPHSTQAQTELQDAMDQMQDAYRTVGRALRKPQENLSKLLDAAQAMQEGAIKSKALEVEIPPGTPDEQTDEYQLKYRILMNESLLALVQFEQALLKNDFDAAKKAFAAVKASKADGHDAFKVD
ncbi:MAG: cytochrome b562 [Verrucomicrobiota bacterium]